MLRAGRSFTEPAGLLPSSLTRMVLLEPSPSRCKRTSGVEPTKSSMVGNAIPALSNTDSRYCWPHNGDSRAEPLIAPCPTGRRPLHSHRTRKNTKHRVTLSSGGAKGPDMVRKKSHGRYILLL